MYLTVNDTTTQLMIQQIEINTIQNQSYQNIYMCSGLDMNIGTLYINVCEYLSHHVAASNDGCIFSEWMYLNKILIKLFT